MLRARISNLVRVKFIAVSKHVCYLVPRSAYCASAHAAILRLESCPCWKVDEHIPDPFELF
jgi:hypothetical protein